jgi:heme/copper-type cytochrome/quinol oxidase subunit 2
MAGESDARETGHAARRARRANRRLEHEWIVIPAIIVTVFVIAFGAKLLFG